MSDRIAEVLTLDGPVQVDTFCGQFGRPMVQISGAPVLAGAVQMDRAAFITLMRQALAMLNPVVPDGG